MDGQRKSFRLTKLDDAWPKDRESLHGAARVAVCSAYSEHQSSAIISSISAIRRGGTTISARPRSMAALGISNAKAERRFCAMVIPPPALTVRIPSTPAGSIPLSTIKCFLPLRPSHRRVSGTTKVSHDPGYFIRQLTREKPERSDPTCQPSSGFGMHVHSPSRGEGRRGSSPNQARQNARQRIA